MVLDPIVGKLDAVRRRVRRLVLVDGLSRTMLVACACAVATFLIDYFVPKVPFEVRLTLLGASLATIAWAAWRFIVYPLGVKLTDDDIALCVEKQYPDLNDRLISAIQLSREGGKYSHFNSPQLVDAIVAEAMKESEGLDFGPVVVPAGPMKMLGWTAGVAMVLAVFGLWQTEAVKTWAMRLVSDKVQWPRKTTIVVTSPASKQVTIAKGEDLDVEIETRGVSPRKAVISYRFTASGEKLQRPMRGDGAGRFRFTFSKVIEPVEFWVEAGDDETDVHRVSVLSPPTVERIALLYDFPPYTQLKDTDPTVPVEDGNIVAPVGTKVHVAAHANLEIAKAKLLVGKRGEEEVSDIEVKADAQGRPMVVVASVDVKVNTHYAIWLQATNGLQTTNPVRYSIKATEDKAPEIRVSEPNMDKYATEKAEIPIRISTSDDFGVTSLVLVLKTSDTKRPQQEIALDAFNNESYPAKKMETEYFFKMSEHGLKEGTVVQYQIVARDGREIPGHNETRSRLYQFTIISRDALLKKMEDMLARLREEIRRIVTFQESGRSDVARLMDALGEKDTLEVMERQSVNATAANQRRITQHLERVMREFDEIVKDMTYNKLFEGQGEHKLRKPQELLRLVTEVKSPDASTVLGQAASVVIGRERLSKLGETSVKQDEIISDLNQVLAYLTEYETYMEVVRTVREMIQKAEDNLNNMKNKK